MAFLHPSSWIETKSSQVASQTLFRFKILGLQPKKWVEWVPWAEFSYNTSTHSSTKFSPFEAVYGVPPPSFLSYIPAQRGSRVTSNLRMAQDRMKSHVDQRQEMFISMLGTSFT
ncbi:hypothetical protein AAG906_029703 [Vitis piasezkii]